MKLDVKKFSKLTERQRLDSIRHPKLLELRQETLREIFPYESAEYKANGMRGVFQKKTKSFIGNEYREKRRNKDKPGRKNKERIETRAKIQKLLAERKIQ